MLVRFREMKSDTVGDASLGLIVRRTVEAGSGSVYCLLAVDCGPDTRVCVALKGSFNLRVGDLILLNFSSQGPWLEGLRDFQGNQLVLLNELLDPTLLQLPKNWASIRGQPPQRKSPVGPVKPPSGKHMVKCPTCGEFFRLDQLDAHRRWDHPRQRASNF